MRHFWYVKYVAIRPQKFYAFNWCYPYQYHWYYLLFRVLSTYSDEECLYPLLDYMLLVYLLQLPIRRIFLNISISTNESIFHKTISLPSWLSLSLCQVLLLLFLDIHWCLCYNLVRWFRKAKEWVIKNPNIWNFVFS